MMNYPTAKRQADRIVELFTPHCSIVNIAGSIRREKKEVKDIEIVCLPKKEFIQTDLLGGGCYKVLPGLNDALKSIQQQIIKGNAEGRYMQMIIKGGATLDLFMPQKEDYYRQLAIRTGKMKSDNYRKSQQHRRLEKYHRRQKEKFLKLFYQEQNLVAL